MAESPQHRFLVSALEDWVAINLLQNDRAYLLIDNTLNRTPNIYGFVPDLCVLAGPNGEYVIGEAKTTKDLENFHTINQLNSFLKKCSQVENSYLVIAVPWDVTRLAKSIIKQLINDRSDASKVSIVIIQNLVC